MDSAQRCKVHGTILRLMEVPVRYGLQPPDEELWAARAKLFPNSKRYVLGGCMVGAIGDDYEDLVCDECRKAENAWRLGSALTCSLLSTC